ncbi:MAG: pilus assembly protein N-terminal domain-containing protein [Planctomycetota bacterium]|nr:pilus assembly protein N-terminal domain-containing protein [Planctomycetota bacterium]
MFSKRVIYFCVCMTLAGHLYAETPLNDDGQASITVATETESLKLRSTEQRTLVLPFNVRRLYFGDSQLLKVEPLSPTKIRLSALKPGKTEMRLFSAQGHVQQYDIVIHASLAELKNVLAREFPNEQLAISELNGDLLMSGRVSSQPVIERIERVAAEFYPQVVNHLEVVQSVVEQQIQLKVRIMEISHLQLEKHNIQWPLGATKIGKMEHEVVGQSDKLRSFLKAAADKNLFRLVAVPEMLTIDGRTVEFEIGGKLPRVTPNDDGKIDVEYEPWGLKMAVLPERLANGEIRLSIKPRVTQVDASQRTKTLHRGLPQVRHHQRDVVANLGVDEQCLIYGMPLVREHKTKEKIPLFSDLPLIGETIYSSRKVQEKIDLLILVEAIELKTERVASAP